MAINFNLTPEFSKEFERLSKKYMSLEEDLEKFKKVIEYVPTGNGKHFNIINKNERCIIVKARLFCRYLKRSSLRVVYSYFETIKKIEFVEIYYKGEKENEDYSRIKDYLSDKK